MGNQCGGITMERRKSKPFGLRAGSKLGKSSSGEVSWVKKMGEAFTGSKNVVPAGACVSTPAPL